MALEKVCLRSIEYKKAVVMLGMFDGLHIGHQELVEKGMELARKKGLYTVLHTFKASPKAVLGADGDKVKMLSTLDEMIALAEERGVDVVAIEEFNREFAALSPEAFFENLCGEFDISDIVVGFNYSFGAGAQGTCGTLMTLAKKRGIKVHVVLPVTDGGDNVSSTLIKLLLSEGNIERANRLLGRAYEVSGRVVGGQKIARTMGFPTANIEYNTKKQLPANGVYAVLCGKDGAYRYAVCNVGVAPTLRHDGKVLLECYLLSGGGDMYDDVLTVKFYKRIREERAFTSESELADRIKTDAELARAYLSTYVK